jgi:hypothetical protein
VRLTAAGDDRLNALLPEINRASAVNDTFTESMRRLVSTHARASIPTPAAAIEAATAAAGAQINA